MKQLKSSNLTNSCKTDFFDFDTTKELSERTTFIGQQRLTSAVDFGVNMQKMDIIFLHWDRTKQIN